MHTLQSLAKLSAFKLDLQGAHDTINNGQVFLWDKYGDSWYGVDGLNVIKIAESGSIAFRRHMREWAPFVGVANKPPQKSDWWYTRCALLRKIYVHGPMGINELCSMYGGGKPHGYGMAHHKKASGAIIRNAVQGLEKLGYLSKVEKKGRTISDKGMKKLDGMATEILQELVAKDKSLKIYT